MTCFLVGCLVHTKPEPNALEQWLDLAIWEWELREMEETK